MSSSVTSRRALPPIDRTGRLAALRDLLAASSTRDALLVTDLTDIRWLTGFTGSNGWLVVRGHDVMLGTDGRYGERALAETAGTGVEVIAESNRARLDEHLRATVVNCTSVGLDAATTSHAEWIRLSGDVALVAAGSEVKALRRVKDDAEIARIEAACSAADAALIEVEPLLFGSTDTPVTEADIRDELEYRMRRHGADDRSYDTIVAAGPDHAARPHHEPSRRTIIDGDTVIIDVGALVDGYHSDMTRSYVIGEPSQQQRDLYELVSRSQRAGIEAVAGGVAARTVDSACRDLFAEAGYGDWYLHGTGHGVGLEIHERPFHSQASDETIGVGNVVTVEPGLYRVGFGGFRIEDLLVVTEHGSRRLTHAPERPFQGFNELDHIDRE
jgi:Xaa-Pro aminopeptidase